MHGHRLLAADTHLTLDLVRIVAFLGVHLTLTAIGRPAERARYQTRTLTDPADRSASWSYLAVRAGTGHLAVADPYLPNRTSTHATRGSASTGVEDRLPP